LTYSTIAVSNGRSIGPNRCLSWSSSGGATSSGPAEGDHRGNWLDSSFKLNAIRPLVIKQTYNTPAAFTAPTADANEVAYPLREGMLVGLEFNMDSLATYRMDGSDPYRSGTTTQLIVIGEKGSSKEYVMPDFAKYSDTSAKTFPSGWVFAGMQVGLSVVNTSDLNI
jgi:hypothetical protein